jgi:hypothetical protein
MGEKKTEAFPIEIKGIFPKHRHDVLNANGWGYSDSYFAYENGHIIFKGSR